VGISSALKILLSILAALLLLRVIDPWPVETLRLKYFDALLTISDPVQSETISLYNIDEAALCWFVLENPCIRPLGWMSYGGWQETPPTR
jgi:hypothetical protein